jgi:hypothetical protein
MSTLHGAPAAQTPNPTLRPPSLPYRYPGSASEARYYCSTILVPAPGRPPSSFRPPLLQGCSPFDPPRQGSLPALWWLAPGRAYLRSTTPRSPYRRLGPPLGSRLASLLSLCLVPGARGRIRDGRHHYAIQIRTL